MGRGIRFITLVGLPPRVYARPGCIPAVVRTLCPTTLGAVDTCPRNNLDLVQLPTSAAANVHEGGVMSAVVFC